MSKNWITGILIIILIAAIGVSAAILLNKQPNQNPSPQVLAEQTKKQNDFWFFLHRKSKKEYLYQGVPGDKAQSVLVKEFQVNVGISGERPTPLPKLVGREYWSLIAKFDTAMDPETAPYFLTLDIPWSDAWPYGPVPYEECNGQCDWVRPGSFGLHGIAGNPAKLTDAGSSGCIRHTDEEITYLYNLLNPSEQNPIRYYIEDV